MIDISVARLTHLKWELQLEAALQKKSEHIRIDSYKKCDLGRWLYGSASEIYKMIPEIQVLEREHKLFHLAAEKVTQWHNSSNPRTQPDEQAMGDFQEVQRLSREVIFLLTMIELKMVESEMIKQSPLKSLFSKQFDTAKKIFMKK